MLSVPTDPDLEQRLAVLARRLGKSPSECALAALKAWVLDHEEAQATQRRLGGSDAVVRPPDEFFD